MTQPADTPSSLVDATGRPWSTASRVPEYCPRCHAGTDKRVLSGGFGQPHDVCTQCGHEFSLEETRPR